MTDKFPIKGFLSTSFVDWPGKICSVVFLAGCGFRCVACHNHRLVCGPDSLPDYPLREILRFLKTGKRWIDGVTVTGGEPTIRKNLPSLLRLFRETGVNIKLDTNGSNPAMLEGLIYTGLVDAVFMDVKAPLNDEAYSRVAGVPVDSRTIRRSINILKRSNLEVVFRTTVIPGMVEEPQLASIRHSLGSVSRFVVQPFSNQETLDEAFAAVPVFTPERVEAMRASFEIPSPEESRPHRIALTG